MKKIDFEKRENEIVLALQEWGNEKGYRLFGYKLGIEFPKYPARHLIEGLFTQKGNREMFLFYFDVKESGEKLSILRAREKDMAFKYPMKFSRMKRFESHFIPVGPLYDVLVEKGVILPFESTMTKKAWQALTFEPDEDIKPVSL
jgi:hypothetical protein